MDNVYLPFAKPLVYGKIIKRYKRFLADVRLDSGEVVVAHVANSGSMKTCWEENANVVMTALPNDCKRKLMYSLQAVEMKDGRVMVNTMLPNRAVELSIVKNAVPSLAGYEFLQSEVKCDVGSRFDLCLFNKEHLTEYEGVGFNLKRSIKLDNIGFESKKAPTIVEIKNATMKQGGSAVLFPDAVTERGQKHLKHLLEMHKAGWNAVILFFAGRSNVEWVGPAEQIDPEYAKTLREVVAGGVRAMALNTEITREGIKVLGEIAVKI
ncbi:MAG: DNA/RNA nuclease SfsA [Candidatus Riflebacteria bacterium]|nr:DNA/RNA nuclease SfsA [Candidatus Riflebacteria bacterium]